MKRLFIFWLVALLSFIHIEPVSGEASTPLLKVSGDYVNVRNGAGLDYKVIFQIKYGTVVKEMSISKDTEGNLWYRIYDFNTNKTGFVASWLLTNTGVSIQGSDTKFIAKVNTESLNVRIGPGVEFRLTSTLKQGEKVTIIRVFKRSDGEEWYKFQDKDKKYYYIAGWYTEKLPYIEPPPSGDQIASIASSTEYVNLRKGPSVDFEKVALIEKGDSAKVLGIAKNKNGELWLQVEYNGKIGWVIGDYFKVDKMPTIELSVIGGTGTVKENSNLREGPSQEFKSLRVVNKDTELKITGIANNRENEVWYSVEDTGSTGWIKADLISINKVETGTINNILWLITPSGIDISIQGEKIPTPTLTTIKDPERIETVFHSSKLLKGNGSLEINIFPITRVRYESSGQDVIITVDLVREIPHSFEQKGEENVLLHLTLPKAGEKLVEISGREVYARIDAIDGKTHISIEDFLNSFNIKLANPEVFDFNFFGKDISIDKESVTIKGNVPFISLDKLSQILNVSVLETSHVIFIDPVLTFLEEKEETRITFSFPVSVKRIESNNKYSVVFYADPGNFNIETSKHRNIENPPEIILAFDTNIEIETEKNQVKIVKTNIKEGILGGKTIILDPGHGSYSGQYLDVGATGASGMKEAYVVLDIALRLKALLEQEGAKVILTHEVVDSKENPDLSERTSIANSSGGDLFISIHLNASTNKNATGTETYYWYDTSKALAQILHNTIVSELGTLDRGIKKDYLYVCRNVTTMPSVLLEILFISNSKEEALLKDPLFLDKIAQTLLKGVKIYLSGT